VSQKQGQRLVAALGTLVNGAIALPVVPLDGGLKVLLIGFITALVGIFVYPDRHVPPDPAP
jgi:hypothetical protein